MGKFFVYGKIVFEGEFVDEMNIISFGISW